MELVLPCASGRGSAVNRADEAAIASPEAVAGKLGTWNGELGHKIPMDFTGPTTLVLSCTFKFVNFGGLTIWSHFEMVVGKWPDSSLEREQLLNGHFRYLNRRYLPYKAYARAMQGDIHPNYGFIWYSTSILGSWKSHWVAGLPGRRRKLLRAEPHLMDEFPAVLKSLFHEWISKLHRQQTPNSRRSTYQNSSHGTVTDDVRHDRSCRSRPSI